MIEEFKAYWTIVFDFLQFVGDNVGMNFLRPEIGLDNRKSQINSIILWGRLILMRLIEVIVLVCACVIVLTGLVLIVG